MSIPIPAGHHMVCQTCEGTGTRLRDRATIRSTTITADHGDVPGLRRVRLGTATVEERCRPCEGTGWIPPKTSAEEQEPEAG